MPDLPLPFAAALPDGVGELADLLFGGLAEKPMWGRFLNLMAQRLRADAAAFIVSTGRAGPEEPTVLVPPDQPTSSFARLTGLDGFAAMPFGQPLIFPAPGGGEEEGARADHALLRLPLDGDRSIWLACSAPAAGASALAEDWREVLGALLPLMQRIVRVFPLIGDSERRRRVAEHVLETSGVGVVLADSAGMVVTVNAAAQAIMANTPVLAIHDGRLHAMRQSDQQRLLDHIRQKAGEQRADEADPDCYVTFALLRDDHTLPVTVMVRPGPPYGPASAPLRRTATVILRDPARRPGLAAPDLEILFDLSPAEARLARLLADGMSMEEAAHKLGVSRNTVRTQLQAVFAKTGANRQSDLVRLLLSSAATLAQHGGEAPEGG